MENDLIRRIHAAGVAGCTDDHLPPGVEIGGLHSGGPFPGYTPPRSEEQHAAERAAELKPGMLDGKVPSDRVALAGAILQGVCHSASLRAGWWHNPKTGEDYLKEIRSGSRFGKALVAEKLCLIHSEISEAMEGHRKGLQDDKLPHRPMTEVELADAVIRICDLAGAMGYDMGGAIAEKLGFNSTRPDHRHEARAAAGGKAY